MDAPQILSRQVWGRQRNQSPKPSFADIKVNLWHINRFVVKGTQLRGTPCQLSVKGTLHKSPIQPSIHPSHYRNILMNQSGVGRGRFRLGFQSCDMTHHHDIMIWQVGTFHYGPHPESIQYRLHVACQSSIWKSVGKQKKTTQIETQTAVQVLHFSFPSPGGNGLHFHFISRVIWGGAASNCCNLSTSEWSDGRIVGVPQLAQVPWLKSHKNIARVGGKFAREANRNIYDCVRRPFRFRSAIFAWLSFIKSFDCFRVSIRSFRA